MSWRREGGGTYQPRPSPAAAAAGAPRFATEPKNLEREYLEAARAKHSNRKKSYFDDDSDDELLEKPAEDDDEDPLDAFMSGVEASLHQPEAPKRRAERLDERARDEEEDRNFEIVAAAKKKRELEDDEEDDDVVEYEDGLAKYGKKKKMKEVKLERVDHSKTRYEAINKVLVDYKKDEVETFEEVVPGWLVPRLKQLKVSRPTEVQKKALPAALGGRDVLAVAKTGSGKTLAFGIPMAIHVASQNQTTDGPIALCLSPTRELCEQTYRTLKVVWPSNRGIVAIVGGAGKYDMQKALATKPDGVVATPGRLLAFLQEQHCNLQHRCTFLVIDEVDAMLDLGFQDQVSTIAQQIRPSRQTFCCSATLPPKITSFVRTVLHEPVVNIGTSDVITDTIDHSFAIVKTFDDKVARLRDFAAHYGQQRILVFVNQKKAVEDLVQRFQSPTLRAIGLHGDMDAGERSSAVRSLQRSTHACVLLFATDVASRGLDLKNLDAVVNFDNPATLETFVHRVGRVGRHRRGLAFSLLQDPSDKPLARAIVTAFRRQQLSIDSDLLSFAGATSSFHNPAVSTTADRGFGAEVAPPSHYSSTSLLQPVRPSILAPVPKTGEDTQLAAAVAAAKAVAERLARQ